MRVLQIRRCATPQVVVPSIAVLVFVCAGLDLPGQTIRGARGRGTVVRGEEASVAVGRRGAVVKGDEGYAAVGRRGAVAVGDDRAAAVGPRGAVVAGEEGAAAVGRRGGVVVGNRYEDYEGWRVAAGVGAAIAVGTMLARPPAAAVTVAVGPTSYWYHDNVFYTRVISGGTVVYQVVGPPAGAIITTLPRGCVATRVGAVTYQHCGGAYYQRVSTGYRVVVL